MFEKGYSLKLGKIAVVPLAGTWIEILGTGDIEVTGMVVPLAGTWIEIGKRRRKKCVRSTSFPLRERGLKSRIKLNCFLTMCRSPCGNVD